MAQEQTPLAVSGMPEISAIYFALLQCGYDYYALGRSEEHADCCRSFAGTAPVPDFFSGIRQDTCEVYPYWPRAAILEAATFHLSPDFLQFQDYDAFRRKIMSAGNIADCERDSRLWKWLEGFPAALSEVLSGKAFSRYLDWECEWMEGQKQKHTEKLKKLSSCLDVCVSRYGSPVREIEIVLNPVKCIYSADYYLEKGRFVFVSGRFCMESVVHEFLHHVISHSMHEVADGVLRRKKRYSQIDASYYLSGDDAGYMNAFEEYAVRTLTKEVMEGRYPESLKEFLLCLASDKQEVNK